MAPARKASIFQDTIWLGGRHGGYPLVPLQEYIQVRRGNGGPPTRALEMVAGTQCHLAFGLLEAALEIEIAESTMLRRNECDETVMASKSLGDRTVGIEFGSLGAERNASNRLFGCRRH